MSFTRFTRSQTLPGDAGQVRIGPEAGGAIGRALVETGRVVSAEATEQLERRRTTQYHDALTTIESQAGDLFRQLEDDPDLDGKANRHASGLDQIRAGVLTGIGDAAVRRRLEETFRQRIAPTEHDAMRTKIDRQLDDRGRAGLLENLDTLSREAARATDEVKRGELLGRAEAMVDDARDTGLIGSEAAAQSKIGFREQVAEFEVSQLLRVDPQALKRGLKSGAFEDLAPGSRQRWIDAADRELTRVRNERLGELQPQVRDAIKILDAGGTPGGLAGLQGALGTDADTAEMREDLVAAIDDRDTMANYVALPFGEQARILNQRDARITDEVRDLALDQRMARQHAADVQLFEQDPFAYGELRGLLETEPLDVGDAGSLARRTQQATYLTLQTGRPVVPLRKPELEGLRAMLQQASPDVVTEILRNLNLGLGEDMVFALSNQLALDDPALAVAINGVIDRPLVSSEIIKGQRMLDGNPDVRPTKFQRVAARATVFGSLFDQDDGRAVEVYTAAAEALYAAVTVPTGDLSYDEDRFQSSLFLSAGGLLDASGEVQGGPLEFNGRTILPPLAGMEDRAFESFMDKDLTDQMLLEFGNGSPVGSDGTPLTAEMFKSRIFGSEASLASVGADGRYWVIGPGGNFVVTNQGEVYELNLRNAIRGVNTR